MSPERTESQEPADPDAWWDELPESIREGFRAEQVLWEKIEALEAEFAKPRGILGFFGYTTRPGCY